MNEEETDRREKWFKNGLQVGFTPDQLNFLADYFAFFSDVPKRIEDLD